MTISTETIRAAVYQRVSSNQQNDRRQDFENEEAVTRHGWQATAYREARGVSASRFGGKSRAVWQAIRDGIVTGQVDVVVVHEVSRADRKLTSWSEVLDVAAANHVLIYVTSRDRLYDVSRADDWEALALDGIRARQESETLSTRVRSGKAQGMREGRPQGSIAYGIRRVRDPYKAKWAFERDEPHPDTAPVAARIIRAVGSGEGYRAVAEALNAEGIPAPKGGHWGASSVVTIAGNPRYAEIGVVTEAESLAARGRLAITKRMGERPRAMRYRYSRVLACGKCHRLIRGLSRAGRDRYVCPQGCASIPAVLADTYIDALCIARLARPDLRSLFERADTSAAAAARAESAGYRSKIAEATESYNADRLPIEALEAVVATNRPKAEAAERRARDAETPSALAGLPDEDRAVVAARWDALTLAARKAAFRALAPDAVLLPTTKGHPAPVSERVILWPEGVRETATRRQR